MGRGRMPFREGLWMLRVSRCLVAAGLVAGVLASPADAHARTRAHSSSAGSLDPSFGKQGYVKVASGANTITEFTRSVVLSSGKILSVGSVATRTGSYLVVMRTLS